MIKTAIALLGMVSLPLFGSTKAVYPVWQPISLHGTDVTSVPGFETDVDFGVVMSRPVIISGALPEALVYAVAVSHKLPSVGDFVAKENNLLVLFNIKVDPTMTEEGLSIVFDLSALQIPDDMEVSVRDALKLGVRALKSTLQSYADAHLHKNLPCVINIKGLTAKNQSFRELAERFVIEVPVRPEEQEPLPEEE